MNGQQHEMVLEKTHSSGTEEWVCPTCGRRMVITWNPWKKVVLNQGDINVAHSGSKGGLRMGPVQITQGNQVIGSSVLNLPSDDPYLAPWQRWLDSVDNDDLWNKEI
jgi:hypothetical protein